MNIKETVLNLDYIVAVKLENRKRSHLELSHLHLFYQHKEHHK